MINYYYFIDVSPLLSSLFLLQQPHLQLKRMLRERHVKYSYFVCVWPRLLLLQTTNQEQQLQHVPLHPPHAFV